MLIVRTLRTISTAAVIFRTENVTAKKMLRNSADKNKSSRIARDTESKTGEKVNLTTEAVQNVLGARQLRGIRMLH